MVNAFWLVHIYLRHLYSLMPTNHFLLIFVIFVVKCLKHFIGTHLRRNAFH